MSVVFHKKQKDIIFNAVNGGALSHAYIVEGQAGIGKKTFALQAAKAILCKWQGRRPCGKCPSCAKVDAMSHPDLIFLSASESGTFKVESIRELIKTVYYLPNESEKKVYILDMAHKMTPSAQNALLKVFEEPPRSAVFFVLTEKRDALLPTVISRGQIISLLPPDDDEIMEYLREKFPQKDDALLRSAAEIAGNVPGAAAGNTDKTSCAERDRAIEFASVLFSEKPEPFKVYTFLLPAKSKRENVLCFLDSLIYVIKELAVYKLTKGGNVLLSAEQAESMTSRCSAETLYMAAEYTANLYCNIENNGNLTVCIADYCSDILNVLNNWLSDK